ncbi:MAG: FAD-binding protein [Dysosmobacter sp.]
MRWAAICPPDQGETWHRRPSIYADQIYLEFGADEHIEGSGHMTRSAKEIRTPRHSGGARSWWTAPSATWARKRPRHLSTPSSSTLLEHGVEMYFGYECSNLILENDVLQGRFRHPTARAELEIYAKHTVVATGRRGARLAGKALRRSTTSPTPPALWTSASVWRSAMRSWRP